jgi:hypothetical protein
MGSFYVLRNKITNQSSEKLKMWTVTARKLTLDKAWELTASINEPYINKWERMGVRSQHGKCYFFLYHRKQFGFRTRQYAGYPGVKTASVLWHNIGMMVKFTTMHLSFISDTNTLWGAVAQAVKCLTTGWTIGVRSPTEAEDFFF